MVVVAEDERKKEGWSELDKDFLLYGHGRVSMMG